MSSTIMSFFSKKKTKSIPVNPNSVSSDDFDDDDSDLKSPSTSSSSPRFGGDNESSSLKTRLLPRSEKSEAVSEERLRKARNCGIAIVKVVASTTLGHFAPGAGGLVDAPAIGSTVSDITSLKQLLEEPCDAGEREKCQGLVAYALLQKNRKLKNAILSVMPVVGTIVGAKNKIHNLDKRIANEQGGDRLEQAKLLVDHAKVCHVALAMYAQLVCGDLTSNEAWKEALNDVENNDVKWGKSHEEPVYPAANKVAGNLKPK